MEATRLGISRLGTSGLGAVFGGLVCAALGFAAWMIFEFAPEEVSMGPVQRIVYVHVAVAWCALANCIAMGCAAGVYLVRRDMAWDSRSQACAEVGWLCTTLTLATGSLWAHEAWNTWWTWEPRLTASLILWLVYAAYFLIRSSLDDPDRRARIGAAVAVIALADVPMVIMATRWFRGIHPVSPEMEPRMRAALLASVVATSLWVGWLVVRRSRQLAAATRIRQLEQAAGLEW